MKTIYLKGDIGYEITADKLLQMIDIKSTEKLRVIINSPGGFVDEAFEIYDIFESYKGDIDFVIMPYAASAASYIVMSGDTITAFKNSIFMMHRVSGVAIGDADEMLLEAQIMQSLEDIIIEAYQKRFSYDKDELKSLMKSELWLIGYEQLIDAGIVDNVIDSVDELELEEDEKTEIGNIIEDENIKTSILKLKIRKTHDRVYEDRQRNIKSYEKIAAKLDLKNLQSNADVSADDKIKEEEKTMTLQEFLDSNPDAKAEYEKSLQSVRDQVKGEMEKEFFENRKKVLRILEYEKTAISKAAADAINGDIDIETYKDQKIKEQIDKREDVKDPNPFSALVPVSQVPGEQDEASKSEEFKRQKVNDEEFEKKLQEYREKQGRG